jgi:hypothetical protein
MTVISASIVLTNSANREKECATATFFAHHLRTSPSRSLMNLAAQKCQEQGYCRHDRDFAEQGHRPAKCMCLCPMPRVFGIRSYVEPVSNANVLTACKASW